MDTSVETKYLLNCGDVSRKEFFNEANSKKGLYRSENLYFVTGYDKFVNNWDVCNFRTLRHRQVVICYTREQMWSVENDFREKEQGFKYVCSGILWKDKRFSYDSCTYRLIDAWKGRSYDGPTNIG